MRRRTYDNHSVRTKVRRCSQGFPGEAVDVWGHRRQFVDETNHGRLAVAIVPMLAVFRHGYGEVEPEQVPVKMDNEIAQDCQRGRICIVVAMASSVMVVMAVFRIVVDNRVVTVPSVATALMAVTDRRRRNPPRQQSG